MKITYAWRTLVAALLVLVAAMQVGTTANADMVTRRDRVIAVGGTVRPDGNGRWRVEDNRTHGTRGISHPTCLADGRLRVDLRPRSRLAGWGGIGVDGVLLGQGVRVGMSSAQGARLLLAFTKGGERITCADITAPSGNVWIDWNQILPG